MWRVDEIFQDLRINFTFIEHITSLYTIKDFVPI